MTTWIKGKQTDPYQRPRSTGATVVSRYHDRQEDVVGVNINDLRDFKSASVEEFWQFVLGQFFAVGGFWLGVERLITEGYKDPLFMMCSAFFVAGCVIGYFGYRQLSRRQCPFCGTKLPGESRTVA